MSVCGRAGLGKSGCAEIQVSPNSPVGAWRLEKRDGEISQRELKQTYFSSYAK